MIQANDKKAGGDLGLRVWELGFRVGGLKLGYRV